MLSVDILVNNFIGWSLSALSLVPIINLLVTLININFTGQKLQRVFKNERSKLWKIKAPESMDFLADCRDSWVDEIKWFGQLGRRNFSPPLCFFPIFIPRFYPSSPLSLSYFTSTWVPLFYTYTEWNLLSKIIMVWHEATWNNSEASIIREPEEEEEQRPSKHSQL